MVQYVESDLFSSPARVLVNTVNTVGVMGKGIALRFKQKYPEMYERYRDLCHAGEFQMGQLWLWRGNGRWVLNFPTKVHWRNPSKPEYIEAGLARFAESYADYRIDSISFPLLGCGNGELDFDTEVRPLMERYLEKLPLQALIHLKPVDSAFVPEHREGGLFDVLNEPPATFDEFWLHLRQLTEQNPEAALRTLAKGSPFRLAFADDEAIVFVRGYDDQRVRIPKEDIGDLWQVLRIKGMVSSADAPGRIGREYSLLFPLLTLLPYIHPVKVSNEFQGSQRIALQLDFRPVVESRPVPLVPA